ncbi:MAG: SAM-dependent DNA methyltransferase [Desulfobacteraceae bacterium]|nr:SAM-dependent DNA methyltransferase [Desulfobacteraceae bacterium]
MLAEHIDKIVSTYQYRKEGKRYSRCVSMEEIEKNDYNLNISRYISTAKPEEIIKLDEVNTKLIDLEKEITMTEKKHNKYLKELGLPSLP